MNDLERADIEIRIKCFDSPNVSLSKEAESLITDLKKIERYIEFMPLGIKDVMLKHLSFKFGNIDRWFKEELDYDISHIEFWKRAMKLWKRTHEAIKDRVCEVTWNNRVHSPLLELALGDYWESKEVDFATLTTARIADASLLPTCSTEKTTMQSKMVDFAIVIKSSFEMSKSIRDKLRNDSFNIDSINHTSVTALRCSPISISIVTKRDTLDVETAIVQLGTWVAAHFARLTQLTKDAKEVKMPALPLLLVQGSEWKFLLADRQEDLILILRGQCLGNTTSIEGCYQVVATIRRLAKWTVEVYRPWFEREVLGLHSALVDTS